MTDGYEACPKPMIHNWGCGCPTDLLLLHAVSGVDTPGCDCGHDGMGLKWHMSDCLWRCGRTPPHDRHAGRLVDTGPAGCPDHLTGVTMTHTNPTPEPASCDCTANPVLTAQIGYPVRCPHCPSSAGPVPSTHWTKHVQRHHPEAAVVSSPSRDDLRQRIADTARTVPLRLGPNAIAMAQRGEPIILNMSEADDLADRVLDVVLPALTAQTTHTAARPITLRAIATHLEGRAVRVFRPDTEVYAEYHAVAELLRRMADEAQQQGRSDVGTEFARQGDNPDVAGLAAWETDLTQFGIDTPDCDCGHPRAELKWHSSECGWVRASASPSDTGLTEDDVDELMSDDVEVSLASKPSVDEVLYDVRVATERLLVLLNDPYLRARLEVGNTVESVAEKWCCNGNAENCALCEDPNPPYPFICPGHEYTRENSRRVLVFATKTGGDELRDTMRRLRALRVVVEPDETTDLDAAGFRAVVSRRLLEVIVKCVKHEWICCDPVDPTHPSCVQGNVALTVTTALLTGGETSFPANSEFLDEVMRLVLGHAELGQRENVLSTTEVRELYFKAIKRGYDKINADAGVQTIHALVDEVVATRDRELNRTRQRLLLADEQHHAMVDEMTEHSLSVQMARELSRAETRLNTLHVTIDKIEAECVSPYETVAYHNVLLWLRKQLKEAKTELDKLSRD